LIVTALPRWLFSYDRRTGQTKEVDMMDAASMVTRTMALIVLSTTCAGAPVAPRQQRLPSGLWGGQHASMEVTDAGAQLEFDCAHGRIDQAISLESGRFDVKGTYSPERPGPRREDDNTARTVRYVGEVDGKKMKLTINGTDGSSDAIASFTLEHGRTPTIRKCQ
jgi:hypothetical protein